MADRLFQDRRDAGRVLAGRLGRAVGGVAPGAMVQVSVVAVRGPAPAPVVIAVPAAPASTCRELAALVDEVVCATTPEPFFTVSAAYWDFTQTTDEEVQELLRAAAVR